MKIRQVPKDTRTDIRQCEDCKEQGKDGIFLTLGFFNGFICLTCADSLEAWIHNILFEIGNEVLPIPKNFIPAKSVAQTGKFTIEVEQFLPDTDSCAPEAPRTILGEKVTQKDWEELQDRYIALEAQIQELLNWKLQLGTNWAKLKDGLEDAETYMKKVEERFIG